MSIVKERIGEYIPLDWSGNAGMMATLRREHERGEHASMMKGGKCMARSTHVECPCSELVPWPGDAILQRIAVARKAGDQAALSAAADEAVTFIAALEENPRAAWPPGERRLQIGRRRRATRRR